MISSHSHLFKFSNWLLAVSFWMLFFPVVSKAGGPVPIPDFSATPRCVATGGVVTFTDYSTNTPTSWSWTFQGGTPPTSTAKNPAVTYTVGAGTYSVSLTATNGNGSSSPLNKKNYITVGSCNTYQGIAINTTGATADISAMLDVNVRPLGAANKKGLLLPRMTTAQRDLIPSPASGLLIYNISTNEINFYNGSFWRTFNNVGSQTSAIGAGIGTAEGIAINGTGSAAAPSSMLDVQSATQGLLPARTTTASIASPEAGLLIYNTATNRINYYDGTTWQTPCDEGSAPAAGGAQAVPGISINATGNPAHQSAILDVTAANAGLLLPRMNNTERNALPSPAQGLIIYNTTGYSYIITDRGNRIEFFDGTAWRGVMDSVPRAATASVACGAPGMNQTSFIASWTSNPSGYSNVTYYLDVSTVSTFTSTVAGYNNLNVGNVTSYNVTGLACGTDYYYRVRVANSCGLNSVNSNTGSATTAACNPCVSNTWYKMACLSGSSLVTDFVAFSIGTKGYVGVGQYPQLWEWDEATNVWTQKADFPEAGQRVWAVGFSIGTKGYAGTGYDFVTPLKDFYEYDPSTNAWTQKADFGGAARYGAVGFSIGTKGYIGTGAGAVSYKDFWEYDPSTDIWTPKADFGGTARSLAVGFSIGTKGYIGTGTDGALKKDFYEYDQAGNTWTPKLNFGGTARRDAIGFSIGTKGYIGTGFNGSCATDFWEWNQATNSWTQKADFGLGCYFVGFSTGSKGYALQQDISVMNFWMYCQ